MTIECHLNLVGTTSHLSACTSRHFARSLDGVVQREEHGIKVFLNSLILTQLKWPEGLHKVTQATALTTRCCFSANRGKQKRKNTKQLIPVTTQKFSKTTFLMLKDTVWAHLHRLNKMTLDHPNVLKLENYPLQIIFTLNTEIHFLLHSSPFWSSTHQFTIISWHKSIIHKPYQIHLI